MTFKTGTMVILVSARHELVQDMLGHVKALGARFNASHWYFDPPVFIGRRPVAWAEWDMRPLDSPGDDAIDETLLRLPSPRQEVTA